MSNDETIYDVESINLKTYGYTLMKFMDGEILSKIEHLIHSFGKTPNQPRTYVDSHSDCSVDQKVLFNDHIQVLTRPFVEKTFPGYKIIDAGFFIKGPHSHGTVVHQHPTIIDEEKYKAYTVWVPLSDSNVANGTIEIIEGSHLLEKRVKCFGGHLIAKVSNIDRFLKPVNVPYGSALVFDDSSIHASGFNYSSRPKTHLFFVVVPREAQLTVYTGYGPGERVTLYEPESDFFVKMDFNRPFDILKEGKSTDHEIRYYTDQEFLEEIQLKNPGIKYPFRSGWSYRLWKWRLFLLKVVSFSRIKFGL